MKRPVGHSYRERKWAAGIKPGVVERDQSGSFGLVAVALLMVCRARRLVSWVEM